MVKEHRLGFRADEEISKGLEQLSKKLDVVESEVIRIGIKELMEKHLGVEGDVVVIDRRKYDIIFSMFSELFKKDMLRQVRKMQEESQQKITNKIMKLFEEGKLEIIEK